MCGANPAPRMKNESMRILLIDTAYLGDLVLATPLVRAAAEHSSEGRVDIMTSPAGAPVLEDHPLVGSMYVFHKRDSQRGIAGMRAAIAWIRGRAPQATIMPRRSLRTLLVARAAGVPCRIGFDHGFSRLLLTHPVPFRESLHQVERNLELMRPLGVRPSSTGKPGHPLEVFPSQRDREVVDDWLGRNGLQHPGSFFAMAPGSVWTTKRWPTQRFAQLAVGLGVEKPVLIIGGREEKALAAAMMASLPAALSGSVHDATGLFTAAGSVHLLRHAAVLISNDSGALHLGQAAGIPLVAIYGPTAPSLGYAPRGEGHALLGRDDLACRPCGRHGAMHCPQSHWRCMLDLEVAEVLAAVARVAREAA